MWAWNNASTCKTHLNSEFPVVGISIWAWLVWSSFFFPPNKQFIKNKQTKPPKNQQWKKLQKTPKTKQKTHHQQKASAPTVGSQHVRMPPWLTCCLVVAGAVCFSALGHCFPPHPDNSCAWREAVGKSRNIWQEVDRWGINFIASLKLISDSINLLSTVKNPFQILGSSE